MAICRAMVARCSEGSRATIMTSGVAVAGSQVSIMAAKVQWLRAVQGPPQVFFCDSGTGTPLRMGFLDLTKTSHASYPIMKHSICSIISQGDLKPLVSFVLSCASSALLYMYGRTSPAGYASNRHLVNLNPFSPVSGRQMSHRGYC